MRSVIAGRNGNDVAAAAAAAAASSGGSGGSSAAAAAAAAAASQGRLCMCNNQSEATGQIRLLQTLRLAIGRGVQSLAESACAARTAGCAGTLLRIA